MNDAVQFLLAGLVIMLLPFLILFLGFLVPYEIVRYLVNRRGVAPKYRSWASFWFGKQILESYWREK